MKTLTAKKNDSPRFPRKWLLLSALIAVAIAAMLFPRPKEEKASQPERDPTSKSTYQKRTGWRTPHGPGAQVPATPPIRGTVYDMDGATVAGATILATTFENAGNLATAAASARSDEHGRFTLHVQDGMYFLQGDKDGYGAGFVMAQTGDDIGVVLPKSGTAQGHVYDERGRPVQQFTIDIITLAPEDIAAPPPLFTKRFNSPDGSFRVDRFPAWGAMLRASAPGHSPVFSPHVRIAPGDTQEVNLTLSRGCALVGKVVDEKGMPVSDVLVNAESRLAAGMMSNVSVAAGGEAQSNAEGLFRLENVGTGEVVVRGYDESHAVSTAMVHVSECDTLEPVVLTMSAGGAIAGVVRRSDGTPLAGAKLTVSHRSIGFVNALSDAEGRYRFEHLPPVVVRLDAQENGRHTATNLMVTEGETIERDLSLFGAGSGELRGRITARGMPLRGAQLLVATNRGPEGMDLFYPRTGEDGSYRLPALPDGAYMVIVSSTNRMSSARIRSGSVETVDLDIAVQPERVAMPEQAQPSEPR